MEFLLENILLGHREEFYPVVPFRPGVDKVIAFDLSRNNQLFNESVYSDTDIFSAYIHNLLKAGDALYGIGGYREHRMMYSRSNLFDRNLSADNGKAEEPRCIHLGTDIWGAVGTSIYAPLGGMVHSFAFNNNHGDYGATIILQHQLKTINFYTLYGHLSVRDIASLRTGQFISRGEPFAHFGPPAENGNWPAHLHFQVIADMGNYEGDYPGVCKLSEVQKYFQNCPNPDLLLNLNRYTGKINQ